MNKVFLVVKSGCYDYDPYYNIEIITNDKQKAQEKFNQCVKDAKCDFDFDNIEVVDGSEDLHSNNLGEYILESNTQEEFSLYKDGYAIEQSVQVRLFEMEVQQ